jgi:hypothetical protein
VLDLVLQSLCHRVNILLSIDGVYTLVDVVIINPTRIDLVLRVVFFHGVVAIVAALAKDDLYCNRFLVDMFFPLAIKVFECLH